jgi:hypothetical protein
MTEHETPNLWQMLTMDQYAGGIQRLLSEIVITRVDGAYQVVIKDHDTGKQKACQALTLLNVPDALEKALLSSDVPWTQFKSYKNKDGLKKFDKK